VSSAQAEVLRARFLELAPESFEEVGQPGGVELAAYEEAAARVLRAFPGATVGEVAEGWEDGCRDFRCVSQNLGLPGGASPTRPIMASRLRGRPSVSSDKRRAGWSVATAARHQHAG